jgi:zinc D-Ala-D-Ala carboxypeptidase
MDEKEKEFFKFREHLSCKCGCGLNNTQDDFLNKLYFAQTISGIQYTIDSGCRCPKHNVDIGGAPDSASLLGVHADIGYKTSFDCFLIFKGLIEAGFERLRLYRLHIHVDQHPDYPIPSIVWANYSPIPKKEA